MKIQRGATYSVDLYKEPNNKSDHSRCFVETLSFTGLELINAIISAGMPDTYLTKTEKRNRKDEITFKIKLFEIYVASSPGGELSFDNSRKKYIDSTELGAINYWIGMILTTILGQKKYRYDYMVHLSMLEHFSSTITLKKRTYYSFKGKPKGKPIYKSPDLLAVNSTNNSYGVFESKGYSTYSKKAMERAYDQVKSIKKVNRVKPKHRLAVMAQTGSTNIEMIQKDPGGENCEITIDSAFLHIYHYLPIAELITELKPEEYMGRMRAAFKHHDEDYFISIPLVFYDHLLQIINCDTAEAASKIIVNTDLRKLQINTSEENILRVE